MGPADFVSALYGAVLGSSQTSGGAQAGASYVTLEWPGLPIDPALCGNIWATDNQSGSPEALETFSGMVDEDVPVLSPLYAPSGISLEQVYALVLQATAPAGAVANSFAAAQAKFASTARGSLANSLVTYHASTPNPRTWCDPAGDPGWTSVHIGAGGQAAPPPPPILKPILAKPALLSWNAAKMSAPASKAASVTPTRLPLQMVASAPAVAAAGVSQTRAAGTPVVSMAAARSATAMLRPAAAQAPTAAPSTAFMTVAAQRLQSMPAATRVSLPVVKATPPISAQPVVTAQPVGASQLGATFRYARVGIQRSWLETTLLHLPGWSIEGLPAGSISSGTADQNGGMMPLLPVSFIAVRDVVISGTWSDADKKAASAALSANMVASFGPLTITGGAGSGVFDGSSLRVPGIQIIAWICQVNPKLPPA